MTVSTADYIPEINLNRCIGCGLCVHACPNDVLALHSGQLIVAEPAACEYTGLCQDACPTEAISLRFEIIFL